VYNYQPLSIKHYLFADLADSIFARDDGEANYNLPCDSHDQLDGDHTNFGMGMESDFGCDIQLSLGEEDEVDAAEEADQAAESL
jgi:hypothetical protein